MARFDDKAVIVTGGGGGIGGATCRRFAREGAKVAAFDLNPDAAKTVADAIAAEGGTAQAFTCARPGMISGLAARKPCWAHEDSHDPSEGRMR